MIGKLIVVEGIDGAGTTSQARALVAWLNERGAATIGTRQPSGGPVGTLLRRLLAPRPADDGQSAERPGATSFEPMGGHAMALLFAADRLDHVEREVAPALAQGIHVVSDRWYHSSYAYQAVESELPWVLELNRWARRPDLTLLLDVPFDVAEARRKAAGRVDERYDAATMQRAVAQRYRELAQRLPQERIERIDGGAPLESVARQLRRRVAPLCGVKVDDGDV